MIEKSPSGRDGYRFALAYALFAGVCPIFFSLIWNIIIGQSGNVSGFGYLLKLSGWAMVSAFVGSVWAMKLQNSSHGWAAAMFTSVIFAAFLVLYTTFDGGGRLPASGHFQLGGLVFSFGLVWVVAIVASMVGTWLFNLSLNLIRSLGS